MKINKIIFFLSSIFLFAGCCHHPEAMDNWMLDGFVRPENVNPVSSPDSESVFPCPMLGNEVKWREGATFNPGAVAYDGKVNLLIRSEDDSVEGISKRTSRIGMAESTDGLHFEFEKEPVLFPTEDFMKPFDWPGGCEDPRVAVTEDGTFLILYTSWNQDTARLCAAISKDLKHWEKKGPVFAKAYNGRFMNLWSKSASILTELKDNHLVITKINDQYLMYWGEFVTYMAYSDNLVDWTPVLNEDGSLKEVLAPRDGYFDSDLTECGPPALLTSKGILLLYNGKNRTDERGDKNWAAGAYAAGQALFDKNDPTRLLARTNEPFFFPEMPFEKTGQYKDGTVFIEGLVYFKKQWFLYYGCADSHVGVAVSDKHIDSCPDRENN